MTFGATFDGYFEEIHFKSPSVVSAVYFFSTFLITLPYIILYCVWFVIVKSTLWVFPGRCVKLPPAAVSGRKHENRHQGCVLSAKLEQL